MQNSMNKPVKIKLLCPSLSKLVQLVVWDDQGVDLASIARPLGLDPSTVKINGHFISRGVDLVSTSVTWRSLLKFFSAKGLSTGKHEKDALIVHGKLSKVGSKRSYDCQDISDGFPDVIRVPKHTGIGQSLNPEDINFPLPQNKKLRDSSSGCEEGDHHVSLRNGVGIKRKDSLEDLSLLKKLRLNETNSDFQGIRDNSLGTISGTHFKCGYLSESMKRPRENEVITATACKRIR